MRIPTRVHILLPLGLALAALSGCSITTSRDKAGKDKDVDIRTPFGSLSVHEGASNAKDTGMAVYPGAQLMKDSNDSDRNANVNISSSLFGFKLVVLKYQSDDAPDKIVGFYRKEMGKFGKVLDCNGGFNMNFHRHEKDAEVTCDSRVASDHSYRQELQVGTENNQRIVAVKPSGNGTEFALVYVRAWDDKTTM